MLTAGTQAYPDHAGACDGNSFANGSPHPLTAASGTGGFTVTQAPSASNGYQITVGGSSFMGLLVWAVDSTGKRVGTFSGLPAGVAVKSECSGDSGSTIQHTSNAPKTQVSATYTPPAGAQGITIKSIIMMKQSAWYMPTGQVLGASGGNVSAADTGASAETPATESFFQQNILFFVSVITILVLYIIGNITEFVLSRQDSAGRQP